VVSIAAVRMNAVDLAIGNLLGSNIFNTLILLLDDVFFTKGPIYSFTAPPPYNSSFIRHRDDGYCDYWIDLQGRKKAFVLGMGFNRHTGSICCKSFVVIYS
jgi:Ca2+/Na+ antiporter